MSPLFPGVGGGVGATIDCCIMHHARTQNAAFISIRFQLFYLLLKQISLEVILIVFLTINSTSWEEIPQRDKQQIKYYRRLHNNTT